MGFLFLIFHNKVRFTHRNRTSTIGVHREKKEVSNFHSTPLFLLNNRLLVVVSQVRIVALTDGQLQGLHIFPAIYI